MTRPDLEGPRIPGAMPQPTSRWRRKAGRGRGAAQISRFRGRVCFRLRFAVASLREIDILDLSEELGCLSCSAEPRALPLVLIS